MLYFLLFACAITAEFHNALEEWSSMFSPGWVHSAVGRQLGESSASIEFSTGQISHRGWVVIHVDAPELAGRLCNKSYVAVYSPPDADINITTPIRYQALHWNSSSCETGNASFSFQLNNLHTGGYRAYLLQGGVSKPAYVTSQSTPFRAGNKPFVGLTGMNLTSRVVAVSSRDVTFRQPNEPTHVRVTSGTQKGIFVISWNHEHSSTGGMLRFSQSPDQTAFSGGTLADDPTTWSLSLLDVCAHGPAAGTGFRSMGVQYSVDLNLTAFEGQTIFYAVGDSTSPSSNTFNFTVPLLPGTQTPFPQEWLIYADQGVGYPDDSYNGRNLNNGRGAWSVAMAVSELAQTRVFQGILVSGDVTYADGYMAQVEDYMDMTEPHFSRAVCLTSAGNHEIDWYRVSNVTFPNSQRSYDSPDGSTQTGDYWAEDNAPDSQIASGGECGVSFKVWPQGTATPAKPWYSYAAGLMTMVILSSEHDFVTGSEQWLWFSRTLASINRQQTPWLMVTIHRPMYVAAQPDTYRSGLTRNSNLFVKHLEPLYLRYKVDLVMSGHYHASQRMCALKNFTCEGPLPSTDEDGFALYDNPSTPVHWLIGNAGAITDIIYSSRITLFQSLTPAFGVLTLHSASRLELQIIDPLTNVALDKARILRSVPTVATSPTAPSRSPLSSLSPSRLANMSQNTGGFFNTTASPSQTPSSSLSPSRVANMSQNIGFFNTTSSPSQSPPSSLSPSRPNISQNTDVDCEDQRFANFFANCSQNDFSSNTPSSCSMRCTLAANALQSQLDLPLDCLQLFPNTTIDSDTLAQIEAKLAALQPLCLTTYYSFAFELGPVWTLLWALMAQILFT